MKASCALSFLLPDEMRVAMHFRRDVTVCILDRPRHADLIRQCREAGARIRLIGDGDVAGEHMPAHSRTCNLR